MRVGEPEALPRQPINVRRPDPRRPVTPDVAVPQVVGIDEDDIRRVGGRLRTKRKIAKRDKTAAKRAGRRVIRIGPGDLVNEGNGTVRARRISSIGRLVGLSKVPLHVVECGDDPRRWNRHARGQRGPGQRGQWGRGVTV